MLGEWVSRKARELATSQAYDLIDSVWKWTLSVLPDLMGYATIATGVLVIISGMTGRGMLKPLGIYSGTLILSVSILASN